MKKQWEAEKDEKEKTEALATWKGTLDDLSGFVDEAISELVQLAAKYSRLSLSGSFPARLEKATLLMEQRCRTMAKNGGSVEQLTNMQHKLEFMKGTLDVLREAKGGVRKVKEKRQEGVQKVIGVQEEALRVTTGTHEGGIGESHGDGQVASQHSPLVRADTSILYSDCR